MALIALIVIAGAIFKLGPFSDDPNPGAPTSTGDFAADADRICVKAHGDFADQQQGQPKTASEAAQLTQNLVEVAENELQQIRDLEPPAALRSKVAAYVRAREQGVSLLRKGAAAAAGDDYSAYEAAQAKLAAGQLERQRLAQAVGLKECSQPSLDAKDLAAQGRSPGDTNLDRPNEVNNPPPGTP
ncbi:hypothetical protein BH10ACT11_BH10ACT11_06750 [soil metagenome]